jgi:hypothetical protein
VWKYSEQSATFLFGTTLGDPTSDEIYRALRDSPDGLTRNDIRNLFSRHKDATEIGLALNLLLQRGHARCEQRSTAGRREERWYATYRA